MNIGIFLAQIASIVGWLLLVYSYYKDDIDKLLFVQIISSIFYCASYLLLGAYSGLIVCFIELLKGIGYYKTDKDDLIFFLTFPIYIFVAIFTYDGLFSLLPVVGSVIDGFSLTKNKNIAVIGSVISNTLWLIYDIVILALASAATDAALVVSNIFLLIFGYSRILKTNKLRIVHGRTFSKNIYSVIYNLDKTTYGEDYTWSYQYEKQLKEKNPESLLIIKYNDEIVGYLSYFVVNETEYLKVINSYSVVKEYDMNNIINFQKNKKNYLIIDGINIKKQFQNEVSINLIINKLKRIIINKYNNNYKIESIISQAVTQYEKDLLKKAGFIEYKNYSKNEVLYMINKKTIEDIYLKSTSNKNEYKVYDTDKIKEEMILEIKELDKKFYKDEYLWEDNYQLQLFKRNKNSMIMVYNKNKLIGYLNYLVITREKYIEMISSNSTTDDFKLDEVIPFYKSKKNYLTINSVVIEKKYQNGHVIKLLTRRLKKVLKKMHFSGYKIAGINAIAVSEDGKKFLSRLGFEEIKTLKDNNTLYVLENNNLKKYLK